MKSVTGEETQNARKDVFEDYLNYYEKVWPQGDLKLCRDTRVTDKAKSVLLAERNAEARFTVFDFYRTASECMRKGRKECRDTLSHLIKATEMLEMLCVNLFLFPWKKEIKTLKTFTGPFVYCIQPVLPHSTVKGILESMGYHPETDTEYRLNKKADLEKAMSMGFELFLARLECEYLLEVMDQKGPSECLEIFQQRASWTPFAEDAVGGTEDSGTENMSLPVEEKEGFNNGHSLLDPGAPLKEECQPVPGTAAGGDQDLGCVPQGLEFQPSDSMHTPRVNPVSRTFMTEDKSILEMRESYPDLAIRQRPIFREPQGCPTAPGRQAAERRTPEGDAVAPLVHSDTCTPHLTTGLSESQSAINDGTASLQRAELIAKLPPLTQLLDSASVMSHSAGQGGVQAWSQTQVATDEAVTKLAEKMGQLCMRDCHADEDLKYPVEETVHPDAGRGGDDSKATPLGSPRDTAQPIMCHPSPVHLCSIPSCSSCVKPDAARPGDTGRDTITEPPHSFYIPPCPEHTHHAVREARAEAQQPDDTLLDTYVLV